MEVETKQSTPMEPKEPIRRGKLFIQGGKTKRRRDFSPARTSPVFNLDLESSLEAYEGQRFFHTKSGKI